MLIKTLEFHFRKETQRFQLEVLSRDSSQPLVAANVSFGPGLVGPFELTQLDFDAKDPAGRVDRLRQFGRKLHELIFTPDIDRIWSAHKQDSEFVVLCVRIAPDANELEAVPWETLFDGEEFVAAGIKTTLTRLPLDVQPKAALPPLPLPLKMLALVSSPLDLQDSEHLQVEREQEILLEAINDPAGQGRLRADFEDEAKLEILEGSLETPYQIFHFTGHGMAPETGGGLLLEDAQGKSRPTNVAEVLQSLRRGENSLRLVVLSGCQTARTINVSGFRDMARGLLRRGIPAVVAMQFSISDRGGLKFAESLYSRIAAARALELACHGARRALLLSDDYSLKADALAPVLLTSNGECLQTTQGESAVSVESPKLDLSFYLPLPQLSYGFFGRRKEYRQLRDAILQRNQRAVIVYGIGGVGKTALVSHVATRMKKRFQGVYAFDCSSGTLTAETAMIKLHEYFAPQGVKALEQLLYRNLQTEVLANYLAQVLSQWSLLLIFDNFESLLERTTRNFRIADENLRTFVTTLIRTTAQRSHFLFTSRYLFDLDEKRLGNIESLPLEDLSRPEALSLMQKLQHLAAASYAEKLKALETFGGHPYALVTLDRYCDHHSLSGALRSARKIHAELRSFLAIELNYGELSERSRELLNRLSAFRESVPYEAAEWVLGKKISYAAEILEANLEKLPETLKTLDNAELLRMIEATLPEERRAEDITGEIKELVEWGFLSQIKQDGQPAQLYNHTLVRDFCRDKHEPKDWRVRLRDAAKFYTNATKLIKRDDKSQSTFFWEMEAFELLMEAEDFTEAAAILVQATGPLNRWGFGQYLERQHRRLFDKLDDEGTATILHNFGYLIQARGEYDKALEYFERSLKIKEKLGSPKGVATSLNEIGTIHQSRGDYNKALECYERAQKIFGDLGDDVSLGISLRNVGIILFEWGEYEKALETYERCLEISKDAGDEESMASTLNEIALTHEQRGSYDEALEYHKNSLAIKQKLGNRAGIASSLTNLARIYRMWGSFDEALACCRSSLEIRQDLGDRSGIASTLNLIGVIYFSLSEYERASHYLQSSLKINEDLGDRSGVSSALHQIGLIHQKCGEHDQAFQYYSRSFEIAQEIGSRAAIAITLAQMGKLLTVVGNYEQAFERLFSALALLIELQMPEAAMAANDVKDLRNRWGEGNFVAAWAKATGEDVPDWLKK